jgi:hypothetical protein
MKYFSLLIAVFLLLSFAGCALANDTPRHTADEVTTVVRGFSSQCQRLLPEDQQPHG